MKPVFLGKYMDDATVYMLEKCSMNIFHYTKINNLY